MKKRLKIVHIGAHDTGGSGFFSARAINNHTKHEAVNIRFVNDWARIPAYLWANRYTRGQVRKMIYRADVLHFQIHVKPFFTSFGLDPAKINAKKTLVWYHGTLLRTKGEELTTEARELLPDHIVTLSTPDLFAHIPPDDEAYWLPVPRPFKYLQDGYGFNAKERRIQKKFGKRTIVTLGHPSSSIEKKGSKFFFAVLTDIMRFNKLLRSSIVINTPWDTCMRKYAEFDICLGAATGAGTYGLACVEAAAFKTPAVTLLNPDTIKIYEGLVGEAPPIVTWHNMQDLFHKLQKLSVDTTLRKALGQELHDWMKPIHDEPDFAERYIELITNKK